jgi:flagellar motor switch protein FliN
MAIDAKIEESFTKIAKIIAIEASAKLSSLLNKKIQINFSRFFESTIQADKFEYDPEKNYLYSVNIEEPRLGPIYLLTNQNQMIPILELLQDKEYDKSQEDIPSNLQMLFSDAVQTTIVAICKRFSNLNKDVKLKLGDKEILKMNPQEIETQKVLPDTSEPIGLGFKINHNNIEHPVHLEVNGALVEHLVKNLKNIVESLNISEFEEEIYKGYGVKLEISSGSMIDASGDSDSSSSKIDQKRNLGILRDINMELIIELGRAEMSMKDVLRLTRGSAIELDRQCSDPVDIFVHNQLVARGEVLAIDENFGIKITHILGNLNLAKQLGNSNSATKS